MISLLYKAKKIPAHFFFDETQNMSKENDESQKKNFYQKKKELNLIKYGNKSLNKLIINNNSKNTTQYRTVWLHQHSPGDIKFEKKTPHCYVKQWTALSIGTFKQQK